MPQSRKVETEREFTDETLALIQSLVRETVQELLQDNQWIESQVREAVERQLPKALSRLQAAASCRRAR